MKVLIVDDNSSFLELFELYAENYPQFDFIYGKSGREALEILESEKNNDISLLFPMSACPRYLGLIW
jgi:CheY-like chemotaxis protein